MKTKKHITVIILWVTVLMFFSSMTAYTQEKYGTLDNIIIY